MSLRFYSVLPSICLALWAGSVVSIVDAQQVQSPANPSGIDTGSCDKCDYMYDEGSNVFVISKPCSTAGCYCPVEVVVPAAEEKNKAQSTDLKDVACEKKSTDPLQADQVRLALTHDGVTENLILKLDPATWPDGKARLQIKTDVTKPDYVWEINMTYLDNGFPGHKVEPVTPTPDKIGETDLDYPGGGFSDFAHFRSDTARTRVFHFSKDFKFEITRGN